MDSLKCKHKQYSWLKTGGRGAEVCAGSTLQRRQLMELNEGFVSIKGKGWTKNQNKWKKIKKIATSKLFLLV